MKKIENRLNKTAAKALKLEKKLKGQMKKATAQYGYDYCAYVYEESNTINTLEQETRDSEKNLQRKES